MFINNTPKQILLFGCAMWLLFFVAIPPWWHYDESGHLEVAWLFANHPDYIAQEKFDNDFRKEMALSMDRFGWYDYIKSGNLQLDSDQPVSIGITQFEENPLYYWIVSLPLRFLSRQPVLVQYTVVRFISFLFFILILLFSYLTTSLLFPNKKLLSILVPEVITLTPGFVDSMTGVNNDTLAALAGAAFFYSSARLFKLGWRNWLSWALLLVSSVLCFWAKTTSALLLPLLFLVVFFSIKMPKKVMFGLAVGLFIIFTAILIRFDGYYPWFAVPTTDLINVKNSSNAPDGRRILEFVTTENRKNQKYYQCLSAADVLSARGSEISLTYWVWAAKKSTIRQPQIIFYLEDFGTSITNIYKSVGTVPREFEQFISVPSNARGACLVIQPTSGKVPDNVLYFDEFRATISMGASVTELLHNGSFETGGVRFSQIVEDFLSQHSIFNGKAEFILINAQNISTFTWAYKWLIMRFFYTLWGGLAGTKLIIPGSGYEIFLYVLLLISLASFIWFSLRSKKRKILIFQLIAILFVFLIILFRGMDGLLDGRLYIHARYFLPAILPFTLVLTVGWTGFIRMIKLPQRLGNLLMFVPVAALLITNFYLLVYAMLQFHPHASKILWLPTSAWIIGSIATLVGTILLYLFFKKRFKSDQ